MESNSRHARTWAGRAVLAVLGILLFFGIAEGAARLFGFGYPTSYLIPRPGMPGHMIDNQNYSARFFPLNAARISVPLDIEVPKPEDRIRILVLGESAAMGEPEPAYGLARQLEWMLQDADPGPHYEVINLAMTAVNSWVLKDIAAECIPLLDPDWLVLYMGNNEVIGPFGPATTLTTSRTGPVLTSWKIVLSRSRFLQAIQYRIRAMNRRPQEQWQGLGMFLENGIPPDAPVLDSVYRAFEQNLQAILEIARANGVRTVLSPVEVSLVHCPPFSTDVDATPEARAEARLASDRALRYLEDGHARRAAATLLPALDQLAAYPNFSYLLGLISLEQRHMEAARTFLSRARDADLNRFRADSRIREITRNTAARHGVIMAEPDDLFTEEARHRPGEIFLDHVHLAWEGNRAVAGSCVSAITGQEEVFSADDDDRMMAALWYRDIDHRQLLQDMIQRYQQKPFLHRINNSRLLLSLVEDANRLAKRDLDAAEAPDPTDTDPRSLMRLCERYLRAGRPDLAQPYGRAAAAAYPHRIDIAARNLLIDAWLEEPAIPWDTLFDMDVHEGLTVQSVLTLFDDLRRAGRTEAAGSLLETGLKHHPGHPDLLLQQAYLHVLSGNLDAAGELYAKLTRDFPDHPTLAGEQFAYYLMSRRFDQAHALLDSRPDLFPGQTILRRGLLAVSEGDIETGLTLLQNHIAAHPEDLQGIMQTALLLYRTGSADKALAMYRKAAELAPYRPDIMRTAGEAAMTAGAFETSARFLTDALKLNPDDDDCRLQLALLYLRGPDNIQDGKRARRIIDDAPDPKRLHSHPAYQRISGSLPETADPSG